MCVTVSPPPYLCLCVCFRYQHFVCPVYPLLNCVCPLSLKWVRGNGEKEKRGKGLKWKRSKVEKGKIKKGTMAKEEKGKRGKVEKGKMRKAQG